MPRGTVIATYRVRAVGIGSVPGAPETPRTARGWVSAVDAESRTVRLKGKNDEVSFMLDDGVLVMDENWVATFADLAPGQHVMIRYAGSETERVASEVRILARP